MQTVECELCCCVVNTAPGSPVKTGNSLWTYFYHKNVREALLPLPGDYPAAIGVKGVPKLTFTFCFDGALPSDDSTGNNDESSICGECLEHVNRLEVLHEQLELCKMLIAAQVDRIVTIEELAVRKRRARKASCGNKTAQLPLDVSLAGTCFGKDNITQVLNCLGTLCEGVTSSKENSFKTTSALTTAATAGTSNRDEVNGDSRNQQLVNLSRPIQSFGPVDAPPEPSLPNYASSDPLTTAPPSMDDTNYVEVEVGEIFVHLVKPGSADHSMEDGEQLPDSYPLLIPSEPPETVNNNHRPIPSTTSSSWDSSKNIRILASPSPSDSQPRQLRNRKPKVQPKALGKGQARTKKNAKAQKSKSPLRNRDKQCCRDTWGKPACALCGNCFSSYSSLYRHLRTLHDTMNNERR